MTDKEFDRNIGLMCQGQKEGLRAVYEAYLPSIYAAVASIVRNRQAAEDITADFFIRLWELAGEYRMGGKHKAWMMTIARNMAVDYLRKYQKEQLVDEISDEDVLLLSGESQESRICSELTLKQALKTLEQEEEQIVCLKIMGELTLNEISKIMGKPLGTVAWKYRNALKKLKRCRYE